MHRVLLPFEFFEPTTVGEVVELVDGDTSRILAGGMDLVLKMRLREARPQRVVSLQKVPGLDHVEANGSGLTFGALATLRQIERSQAVQAGWPLLTEAIHSIASVQTKTMGTAVGNLCVGTPASDVAPALYALGAVVKIAGAGAAREVPIEEFFVGVGRTAVGPHEVVTEVRVPEVPRGSGGAFLKLSKTAEDIAKVNAAVLVTVSEGRCAAVKIALGSVAPTALRALEAEKLLVGEDMGARAIAEAADAAAEAVACITDVRSTAKYRREMVKVLVRDGLAKAAARAADSATAGAAESATARAAGRPAAGEGGGKEGS
jgi:carbon-monoxide dehydrogenase medium subunit